MLTRLASRRRHASSRGARALAVAAASLAVLAAGTACSVTQANQTPSASKSGTIQVTASDSRCTVSAAKAPAGNLVFTIKNTGSQVTEFYLYDADGRRVVGEVENIGPGLARQLVLRAPEGTYRTACKPGMRGNGIRAAFVVTKGAPEAGQISGLTQHELDRATALYAAYVKDQAQLLLDQAGPFTTAYRDGDDARARALYPKARAHWESIETVAESFGDLDPRTDFARPTSRPASAGPDGTASRRTCGRRAPATGRSQEPSVPPARAT